jgi:hypothetical protein
MMHFIIKFKISWILKWFYVKDGDILNRHWFVKWWDKFPQTDTIIQNVYKDFAKKNAASKTTPIATSRIITIGLVSPSLFLLPPEEEKPAVVASPSSSKTKKSKKKKKGPSKKEMKMFQKFLKNFREDDDTEEEDENSNISTSQDAYICGRNHHIFSHDPLCSQDSVPSIEDIPELNY